MTGLRKKILFSLVVLVIRHSVMMCGRRCRGMLRLCTTSTDITMQDWSKVSFLWGLFEKPGFGCGLSVSLISVASNLNKSCDLPAVRTS
jgi:hypothetical protein